MHSLVTGGLLGLVLFFAGDAESNEVRHYEAANCEIYVEKIQLMPGSYNSINANLYLKVAKAHLDGGIKEVGFHGRTITSPTDLIEEQVGWRNMVAVPLDPFGTSDLWRVGLLLEAGARISRHEGVFYVMTDKGTIFWLHPMNNSSENFVIDTAMFAVENELVWSEIWIDESDTYLEFNPKRCN
jgi:hypothetical protein